MSVKPRLPQANTKIGAIILPFRLGLFDPTCRLDVAGRVALDGHYNQCE